MTTPSSTPANTLPENDYEELRELLAESDVDLVRQVFNADITSVLNQFDSLDEQKPDTGETFRQKLIELFDRQSDAYGADAAESGANAEAMKAERLKALEEASGELQETVTLAGQDAGRVATAYSREIEDLKKGTVEADELEEIYKTLGQTNSTVTMPASPQKKADEDSPSPQVSMAA